MIFRENRRTQIYRGDRVTITRRSVRRRERKGKSGRVERRADHRMNGPLNFFNNGSTSSKGRLFIKATIARPRVFPELLLAAIHRHQNREIDKYP